MVKLYAEFRSISNLASDGYVSVLAHEDLLGHGKIYPQTILHHMVLGLIYEKAAAILTIQNKEEADSMAVFHVSASVL